MALGTTPFSNTTVTAIITETWTPMILEELFAKTVAANFFTDLSPWAKSGGDIFHVPDLFSNTFPVQTQSTQGTEVTLSAPGQNDVTLTINTHRYIAFQVGDLTLQQIGKGLGYEIATLYTQKIASGLKNALEVALFALWSGLSTNSIGDTATVLTDSEIRRSIEKLATANFDLTECAWFIHPFVFWVQLASVAKYYDMSQAGGTGSFVREGNFGAMDASRGLRGHLYGIPLYLTSNVVSGLQTYRNLLAHKSAFGFATQTPGGSPVRVQSENRLEFLSNVTVADMIYGVVELRDAAAVVVNANNAFIGS